MLASVPSRTLTEWIGFDQATGLVGDRYGYEALAAIHEWIQQLTIVTAGDKEAKVQHFPRPHEIHERPKRYADKEEN